MQNNNVKVFISLFLSFLLLSFPLLAPAKDTDIGAQLYRGNCAKCHGHEGEGFLKLYPPIHNSRFLKEDVSQLPCIIRYGLKGEIVVDGVTFNQIMPATQQLKPEQIENIIRFMQDKWNHPSTPPDVKGWLEDCSN